MHRLTPVSVQEYSACHVSLVDANIGPEGVNITKYMPTETPFDIVTLHADTPEQHFGIGFRRLDGRRGTVLRALITPDNTIAVDKLEVTTYSTVLGYVEMGLYMSPAGPIEAPLHVRPIDVVRTRSRMTGIQARSTFDYLAATLARIL